MVYVWNYDQTKSLFKSHHQICAIGADREQFRQHHGKECHAHFFPLTKEEFPFRSL